jgi:hypothetical protein
VSERIWSVNLKVSMAGEYQTMEEHSGRPSKYLRSMITGIGITGISNVWYTSTMEVIVMTL